jgi:hydroxymethylpyrimidine kinase/phosphomethylpyrimidine kinase
LRLKVELISYLSKLLKFILCQKDLVDEDIITVDRTSNTQVFAKNPPPKPSTLNSRLFVMLLVTLFFLLSYLTVSSAFTSLSPTNRLKSHVYMSPPIIYTIAGSDSGGGAGIQADLKTIHSLSEGQCHGCSAITCLTAQNSVGVASVHAPPTGFLREQLDAIGGDMRPNAVKIGMLGSKEIAEEVGSWLQELLSSSEEEPLVVVDPVMISTSGHKLINDSAKEALINLFSYATLVTPNKFEAEELLGRKLITTRDVEEGAREILEMGCKAVLIKGGHALDEKGEEMGYAQDYLLTNEQVSSVGKPVMDRGRICDGERGVWLRSDR